MCFIIAFKGLNIHKMTFSHSYTVSLVKQFCSVSNSFSLKNKRLLHLNCSLRLLPNICPTLRRPTVQVTRGQLYFCSGFMLMMHEESNCLKRHQNVNAELGDRYMFFLSFLPFVSNTSQHLGKFLHADVSITAQPSLSIVERRHSASLFSFPTFYIRSDIHPAPLKMMNYNQV